ncbi:MAG: SDR family oxidoreductase [Chloroflexi bacterium]|jgi:nucleoside-diphosphate-sugar epimerase|nr:SDR family oxidoreductase [Anaerolineaceae bacterium]NMB87753.1 SDR family oxidoreductase [Chloroflexota bacterium]
MKKLLVTGTGGYIGCMLGPYLEKHGDQVTGVDTGYYLDGWLYNGLRQTPKMIIKDIRNITTQDLEGYDAVIHLAELSNDPLGQHNPEVTYQINHIGSVELAKRAKAAGVQQFIYTSSCSVYGVGTDDIKNEETPPQPQTAYAQCKVLVERDVQALADDHFSPTFLRNATAFGASPRMRFDVVLNNLSGLAWTTKEIRLTSDGSPWRPLVHVLDICEAVRCTLAAPRDAVHGQIFNVGDTQANYRVREIAEIVSETFPGCGLSIGKSDGDNRSYRVSFDKIKACLPDFQCKYTPRHGAEELRKVFEYIDMSSDTFQFRAFTRLKQLKHLINTHQIDEQFFWREM